MDGTRNDQGSRQEETTEPGADGSVDRRLLGAGEESTPLTSPRFDEPEDHAEIFRQRLGFVRGAALLSLSFAALFFLFISFPEPTPAQIDDNEEDPDFPHLFRSIDRRLEESYLDLGRVAPQPLLRKAFSALEFSADEIYVENADPTNPYIPVHVGDKTQVFALKKTMSRGDAVELLESVFRFLGLYYHGESSLNELRYAAANGFLSGIDPHTLVFTPRAFEEFEVHIKGEIFGVGMLVGTNEDGRLEVKQVLKETPAYNAGFKKGDLIAKIDALSTINMTVMEAVQKIRGPRHSQITLTVKRRVDVEVDGKTKKEIRTIPIVVKRDRVEIKSVESKLLSKSGSPTTSVADATGPTSGIGYIQVTNFDKNTYQSLRRELRSLRESNGGKTIEGLVFDLRNNSGGLLTQAIKMTDVFLEKGEIVGTAYKNTSPSYQRARKPQTEPGYPIVVLADKGSASGAEIVIGALQKNNRAIVLGTRTFGKGSVQQLQALPNGAQLKITVSEYLLPGKVSIQETGVVPDILAYPVFLENGDLDLFPSDNITTERDYEAHLVSKYKTNEEPKMKMKYLWTQPEDGGTDSSDRPTRHERFVSGEIQPERDPLVRVATRILALSDKPFRPQLLFDAKKSELEALGVDVYGDIVDRLGDKDIDWSAASASAVQSDDTPDLALTLSHSFSQEKSSDEEDPVPVNKMRVTARVKNNAKQAVHRVKGLTQSDYYLFRDKEFLFGKIAPGETVERHVDIRLPYYPLGQSNVLSVDVSSTDGATIVAKEMEFRVEQRPRPEFAYRSTLTGPNGAVLTRLEPGVDAKLTVTIDNVGESRSHKGIAILRNKSADHIFLKAGRIEIADLEPGKSLDVEFLFETRPGKEPVDEYALDLAIVDSYSSASLRRRLTIQKPGKDGGDYPNGKTFRAPKIVMAIRDADGNSDKPIHVTSADRVKVTASVASSSERFATWATSLALSPKNRDPDKFYYDESRGLPKTEFDTRVPLVQGLNLVTIVAKDSDGIVARRSVMVRKSKAGLP